MNRVWLGNFLRFGGLACSFVALYLLAVLFLRPSWDYRKPQRINCVNNLKQLGIAFRLWEGDHGDQYPCNVSTNAGGIMELCAPDKDGFDSNAVFELKVMAGELTTPKLLICPQDKSNKPALDFNSLGPTNISYRFRSGTNITESNPAEILAVCPIHGNLLYCDGSVREARPAPPPGVLDEFYERLQYDERFQVRLASDCVLLAACLGLLLFGRLLKGK